MNFTKLFLLACIAIFISSCGKDDPEPIQPVELITTLTWTLTDSSGDTVMMSFRDLDGDGGDAPVVSTATLKANEVYTSELEFLNETETPAENVTEEIIEEDLEHQVFYATSIAGLSFSYADMDSDGNPLGVVATVNTGAPGNGTVTITLRHEPAKDASGVSDGNIANAGGETDIEVTFNVDVE